MRKLHIFFRDGKGRNSSLQSQATAFNTYWNNKNKISNLYFYLLESEKNIETEYHLFMYRILKTVGFEFLNEEDVLESEINKFNSIGDIISCRKDNASKNSSNNSTYITKITKSDIEIYGKTYGASKYETSLICYAMSKVASQKQTVTLYQVGEKDLQQIPKKCQKVIEDMGVIMLETTSKTLER